MRIEYSRKAVKYMESLDFALEFIKKLVLAWDSNFTKVTTKERKELEEVEKDIMENGTIPHEAINWD